MALFSFFKTIKPVGFNYHPRFYDERKEEMMERWKAAEGLQGDDSEAIKARVKRNMSRQSTSLAARKARQSQAARSNMRLVIVIAVLLLLAFYAIQVYLPRFAHYFE